MSFFDQLAESISKVTKDFGNKAQEFTDSAKLKSKINEAEALVKSTYAAIGEIYYNEHKNEAGNSLEEQFKIIDDAKKTIEEYKAQLNSIKGIVSCPVCGANVNEGAAFCPSCGAKIVKEEKEAEEVKAKKVCSSCGKEIDEDALFCTNCGAAVNEKENDADNQ